MRTSTRVCAAAATGALLAVAGVSPATAVDPPPTSFVVIHAATGEGDPDPSAEMAAVGMPAGALWSIYTIGGRVTDEQASYEPWRTETPDGLIVEASCSGEDAFVKLPILYVGPYATVNQINVYRPNNIGDEPWQRCGHVGPSRIRVTATDGTVLERGYPIVPAHPGPFSEPDGTAVGTYEQHPSLVDCKVNTTDCPVSVGGNPARFTVYLTGAEQFVCEVCATPGVTFRLNGIAQRLVRLRTVSTGVETATIELVGITAAGAYQLTLTSSAPQPTIGTAQVRFGPPV